MKPSDKADAIRVVVLDIDGVLTDGRTGYAESAHELKFFNVRDGLGIKLLQAAGLKVGVLSGRRSRANRRRASELSLDFIIEGESDKAAAFERLLEDLGVGSEACCYIGDDLVDIAVMRIAGLAVAVADAAPETQEAADWVTRRGGGRGAVREAAEWLLKEQGRWQEVIAPYVH